MALAPFADRTARLNAACSRHLANAECVYDGGEPFGVIFERGPRDVMDVVGGYGASVSLELAAVPGIAAGDTLTIDGTDYTVGGNLEPDETGWARLLLREA